MNKPSTRGNKRKERQKYIKQTVDTNERASALYIGLGRCLWGNSVKVSADELVYGRYIKVGRPRGSQVIVGESTRCPIALGLGRRESLYHWSIHQREYSRAVLYTLCSYVRACVWGFRPRGPRSRASLNLSVTSSIENTCTMNSRDGV